MGTTPRPAAYSGPCMYIRATLLLLPVVIYLNVAAANADASANATTTAYRRQQEAPLNELPAPLDRQAPAPFDPYRHSATRRPRPQADLIRVEPGSWWYRWVHDDNYMRKVLDERYPFLKRPNGTYLGLRDHYNFEHVFWPSERHLAQINMEQHLYDEHRAMDMLTLQTSFDIWSYSEAEELARSAGPHKDDSRCERDLQRLHERLERAWREPGRLFERGATNIELLRWIDSWGRPVSETYYGNSFWTGSYRGCKYASVNLDRDASEPEAAAASASSTPIKFNYCWAKLAPESYPREDSTRPRMSFRAGVCLPRSCDTVMANRLKKRILRMLSFNFSPMHRSRFNRILDVYCLPYKAPVLGSRLADMPAQMRWFLLATFSWLSLIAAVSIHYHFAERPRQRRPLAGHSSNPSSDARGATSATCGTMMAADESGASGAGSSWLKALSVQENLRLFMRDDAPASESRVDLRALGLVKMFSCLMVAAAHCFLQTYWNFHSSTIMIYECRRLHYHAMQFTWKTLETFMVVTGMLTSYFIVSKFPADRIGQLIRPQNFLLLQAIRYVRLAPVMAFSCAFMKAIFIHLSEGPFWDYGTWRISPQGACQAISWWRLLIWPIILDPQARGGSPYQHECLPSSWYVVTELKMYLIIPFFIYALVRWKRLRWCLLLATLGLSTLFKYLQLQAQQLAYYDQFFKYGQMHVHNLFIVSLESSYFAVLDRFHAMAVGLFAGLYLYRYKTGKLKRWPFWMRRLFPALFLAWQLYDLAFRSQWNELIFRQTGHIPSDTQTKLWLVLKPRLDAAMIAIVALRMATDWSRGAMRFSLTIYKLSKLTYCVYMVHTLVLMFVTTATEKSRPDTIPLQLVMMGVFIVVVSFVIALPLYLLVESPFALLIDHLLAKHKPSTALNHSSSAMHVNRIIISDKTNGPGRGADIKQKQRASSGKQRAAG